MYKLKDQHIDFILNDISARGVTIEDLQYNLLDHICCIIENNLEENGDFENFYQRTVQSFFKKDLKEIEDETISLIIFKNYYTMKKVMIVSGTISAVFFSLGLILKFLHLPGASMGIILGIGLLSIVFLPLMFVLKIKEKQQLKDKFTIGTGAIAGILISLGILFKVMHWPYANMMMNASIAILILLFLPFYFFTGIRNPETKVNTTVSTILIVSATGLLFTLMRSPRASLLIDAQHIKSYLHDEKLLQAEKVAVNEASDSTQKELAAKGNEILTFCEAFKKRFIELETENSSKDLKADFESNNIVMHEHTIQAGFKNEFYMEQSNKLEKLVADYNTFVKANAQLPIEFELTQTSKEANSLSCFIMLGQLNQIERTVLHNQRALIACK
ncbi:MAG: hypothetical protein ACK50A_03050 [Sphingobacteriaceae bacterium]